MITLRMPATHGKVRKWNAQLVKDSPALQVAFWPRLMVELGCPMVLGPMAWPRQSCPSRGLYQARSTSHNCTAYPAMHTCPH